MCTHFRGHCSYSISFRKPKVVCWSEFKHTTGGKYPVERALNLNISFVFKYLHDLGLMARPLWAQECLPLFTPECYTAQGEAGSIHRTTGKFVLCPKKCHRVVPDLHHKRPDLAVEQTGFQLCLQRGRGQDGGARTFIPSPVSSSVKKKKKDGKGGGQKNSYMLIQWNTTEPLETNMTWCVIF